MDILLSKSTWFIIKWVCEVLGIIINGIYIVLDKIGIPNIGLAIIFFTIVINVLLTPLQVKQQKFSKMMNVMQPELQKLQAKYKNKKDQASQMKMQEETMAIYQRYGVSPTGSCLPMIIQMPIMFALYQVIYHIPGYIGGVKQVFSGAVEAITNISGYSDVLTKFITDNSVRLFSSVESTLTTNNITDILYILKPSQWEKLADMNVFSGISDVLHKTAVSSEQINMFLGINITESPLDVIRTSWNDHSWLLLIGALLVPVLAWFTQWISYKLMPQQATPGSESGGGMANSLKTMNTIMPVMSAFFCMTFSIGIGIYWIAGAVCRCIQQMVINKQMNKLDVDQMIAMNQEKVNKKREKRGLPPQKITQQAKVNVRNIEEPRYEKTQAEKQEAMKKSTDYYNNNKNLKAGSLASKANMVRQFDDKKKK
ncbi:MAG: YidC/Oxa1 family membrane protein insertase [Lachnospiraceae bacterium]|nr:YidC/Oxa1 family membrane protein insertase [Lachnospiraceae bacterium]